MVSACFMALNMRKGAMLFNINGVHPPLLLDNAPPILFNFNGVPHIPFHGTGVDLSGV